MTQGGPQLSLNSDLATTRRPSPAGPCRDSAPGLGFTLQHRLRRVAKDEHASVQCGSTIATCGTLPIPIANLAGVFRLARVPIKLLLEIGLGVDGSTERTHRDFEFPAAKCADCDDRG